MSFFSLTGMKLCHRNIDVNAHSDANTKLAEAIDYSNRKLYPINSDQIKCHSGTDRDDRTKTCLNDEMRILSRIHKHIMFVTIVFCIHAMSLKLKPFYWKYFLLSGSPKITTLQLLHAKHNIKNKSQLVS